MSASKTPASVTTRLAAGSIERMVRLHEPHPGLDEVTVGVDDHRGQCPPEHDVELGEAEHEPLGLVDQDEIELVAEPLGQPRRELETAETRTEHQNSHPADST